ncbi:MAG: hypothetical protein AAFX44_07415 [Pseudomonadota bacterium]
MQRHDRAATRLRRRIGQSLRLGGGLMLVGWLSGCSVATPFRFADDFKDTAADCETVTVAVTHARYNPSLRTRDVFWSYVGSVEETLATQPGFVGYSKRRQVFGNEAWTMSVWVDEEHMARFVDGDAHLSAIHEAAWTMRDAAFARLTVACDELPLAWPRALELLAAEGRSYR